MIHCLTTVYQSEEKGGVADSPGVLPDPMLEKDPISVTVSVNSEGDFQMEEIPAGMWLLSAFQDKDGNGRYTFGKALPMVPAEPFTVLSDTIEVRANWDVEGIIITYPEKQKP